VTAQQRLLLRALAYIWAARLALTLLPFGAIRRLIDRPLPSKAKLGSVPTPERQAWAILAMRRFVPRPTCLVQAVAGQWLLRGAGYPAQVQIGVSKGEAGKFTAHAWLEHGDEVLIGAAERARYVALPQDPGPHPLGT
jgi:hypothetical protein